MCADLNDEEEAVMKVWLGAAFVATALAFAGMRHDPPVVSQMEQVARFAATEAPAPPLLPPGVRSVS